jgi:hypothetical protein
MSEQLTKTLLLTIALPDFWAEDITPEHAEEYWEGDMREAALEPMDLITMTARLLIARGDMSGNDLVDSRAVIISADVVEREASHDEVEDERLSWMVEEWQEDRVRYRARHDGGESLEARAEEGSE